MNCKHEIEIYISHGYKSKVLVDIIERETAVREKSKVYVMASSFQYRNSYVCIIIRRRMVVVGGGGR